MARPAADSVRVTWTLGGQGSVVLGPVVAGFQAFPAAFDNQIVSYSIESADGTQRENGFGTYTVANNTLTRDFITFSTAGTPTKVPFTNGTTKHVRVTPLAHDVIENRATTDPGAGDDITDGYVSGRARWLNTTTDIMWTCVDHTVGAAIWAPLFYLRNSGTFNPSAISLNATRGYTTFPQNGPITFALSGVAHIDGATATVRITGDGVNTINVDGTTVFWADGVSGPRTWDTTQTVGFWYSAVIGGALAFAPRPDVGGGGGTMSANEILTSLQSLGSPVPGFNADLLDGQSSGAFATSAQGGRADTALQAPTRLVQTGDFALQSVISGTAGVRHNTLVELTGTVDQTVDLSTLAADAYVAISDNHGTSEKRLTGGSNMRAVGHPDEPFNPLHPHVFLAPWGSASVDYKHSTPLARVSGAILQLPHGAGINPVNLSASTIDFDANAAGKLTLIGGEVSTWTDTLSVLAVAPTQSAAANRPVILGTAGATDYRVSFDSTALASSSLDLFASNTIVLPATGFTFYFAGAYGLRSATTSFHSWGLAPSCFRLRITTGDATSAPFSVQFQSPSEPSLRTVLFLDDFAWRNQQKFCFALSFNADAGSTVTAFGFHSDGGAERGSSTWVQTTITATELRLGPTTGTIGSFGYIQQYGMAPVPSSDMQLAKILRFLQLKWAI